jgi:hypothetical protein
MEVHAWRANLLQLSTATPSKIASIDNYSGGLHKMYLIIVKRPTITIRFTIQLRITPLRCYAQILTSCDVEIKPFKTAFKKYAPEPHQSKQELSLKTCPCCNKISKAAGPSLSSHETMIDCICPQPKHKMRIPIHFFPEEETAHHTSFLLIAQTPPQHTIPGTLSGS